MVGAGWVQGIHQTAFRGELEAMAHALTIASLLSKPCRVWSDCQSVVLGVRRLQQGVWRLSPNMPHFDKWDQIRQCLEAVPNVVVVQVYSHIAPSVGGSYIEFWAFWHNSLVDMAAGRANMARGSSFWDLWKRCEADLHAERCKAETIAKLIVATGKRADQECAKPEKAAPRPKVENDGGEPEHGVLASDDKQWKIPPSVSTKFGTSSGFLGQSMVVWHGTTVSCKASSATMGFLFAIVH